MSEKIDMEEQKISLVDAPLPCQYEGCKKNALSLSVFCWEHIEDPSWYRHQIEGRVERQESLRGFILEKADLRGAILEMADLRGADLVAADLREAKLWEADLQKAELVHANLEAAELTGANLQDAVLISANMVRTQLDEADFRKACLIEADLQAASLSSADMREANLGRADLRRADLSLADLRGARLGDIRVRETVWERARLADAYLFFHDLREVHMDARRRFWCTAEAEGTYRTLKNYFRDVGEFPLSGRFHVYEARAHRTQMRRCNPARWGSYLLDVLCGYGEAPFKVIAWWLLIVGGFGVLYRITGAAQLATDATYRLTLLDAIYFSIVTFTTLGYGDFQPMPWARPITMFEALIGAFVIALFVLVFGRQMMR